MLSAEPPLETEEDGAAERPGNSMALYVGVAASPVAIVLGSTLPLWVLAFMFIAAFTVLAWMLARARRLLPQPARETDTDDRGQRRDSDSSDSNRVVSWSGEYRHRNEPGLFYGEAIKQTVRELLLTGEEKALRKELTHRVAGIVHNAFPGSAATAAPEGSGASVSLYGSGASKTCLQGRNWDLCLRIVEELGSHDDVAATLCNALWEGVKQVEQTETSPEGFSLQRPSAVLPPDTRTEDMEEVTVRTRGGKHIVRFLEPWSGVTVDVGINVHEARLAASLLREYASVSKRAQQLIVSVKHWADRREICASYAGGTLNSYATALMVISFLQRRELPVVPVFPCDRMGCSKSRAASFGGTRSGFQEIARANSLAHEAMRQHVGELLLEFFEFYGTEFDPKTYSISVRTGELLRKKQHQSASPLVIEDPIVPEWNVAACVDAKGLHKIRKECRRATRILSTLPATKKLWKRFLAPPQEAGSSTDLRLSSEQEVGETDEDESEVCGGCSECAQLVRK